ncbi:non-muscle caldesmon isoform X2 [Cheilinus undulatus]|uniref:non-muscle caldesmon isoform X2 n=1 Tax=Cheilinus undulatus TaxID=241271 RepID=UPI001BD20021|nr:non-muscle caldesmon isoform X2 [Cheilinus undulatus]
MSNALLRRNSSKQGLQNLMRLTAQRSVEDAEEVERERRRRAREASRWTNGGSLHAESSSENETPAEESMYDGGLKPSSSPSLEEDEGFSDWTQRREKQRQQRLQELSQGGEEEEEEEVMLNKSMPAKASSASHRRVQRQEQEETERRKEREEEEAKREREREEEEKRRRDEAMMKRREESQRPNKEVEKRKEVKISYTSKVFVQQEPKHSNGDATSEEVMSYTKNKTKRSSRSSDPEESEAILETEQRLEKIRQGLQQKESQELEQLRHRQAEAEQELEELKRRREDRRRVREEEERRRQEEEQHRLAKEEEERRQMKEDIERRRMEAAERMKILSVDGDETFSPFSPKAPTHKITERTESLNRSLKKSNSFKKTQPLVLLPKIDDKMEQYAHAVEETRAVKAPLNDLPTSSPEVVASKKNLFEAGEAWSQSPSKGASCKETEGLKVGVANRITQWVKGPSDGGRQSPCRPADVKPGDVMQKKNMWEGIRDSSERAGGRAKGSAATKKYKFVVTGHGKYEKIAVDDEDGGAFSNGKSDSCHGYY